MATVATAQRLRAMLAEVRRECRHVERLDAEDVRDLDLVRMAEFLERYAKSVRGLVGE